ncbi:MAG: methyltransferase domain-containing protein [Candidatus Poribacteria bacterium]|nr:methyltransferase domain-containing protein [Candidatus Poribacteria bacterium]
MREVVYPLYSVLMRRGLVEITRQEIQRRLPNKGKFEIVAQEPERVLIRYSGDPRDLLSLRSAEQVFLVVKDLPKMTRSRRSLTALEKSLGRIDFQPCFDICRRVGIRVRKRVTFCVRSRMVGLRNFRRADLQRGVERALMTYGWRLTEEKPALEIWVEADETRVTISIKLSSSEMARRNYKRADFAASLRPTVAYCLVQLSDPQPEDIFVDPMCRDGTILIERAHSGRYRCLLGGDISPEAVEAAQTNIGRKHQPLQLFHWNPWTLPFDRRSVDKIVCSLPSGEKDADESEVAELYWEFLTECERAIKPTGRIVLLTTHRFILDSLLKALPAFTTKQRFKIDLRTRKPWVYVCVPTPDRSRDNRLRSSFSSVGGLTNH